jgi:small subunit ribosomal protein S17
MPKKQIKGLVTSTKMNSTVVVTVDLPKTHPVYKKLMQVTRKYKAHDDLGVEEGDSVLIEETAPYSKTVTWKVVEKLSDEDK